MLSKKIKALMVVSLVFNAAFVLAASAVVYKTGIAYIVNKTKAAVGPAKPSPFYSDRVTQFDELSTKNNQIVFLGDSLTQYGEWNELTGMQVLNRGISGDTTDGILQRLDQITRLKPAKLFIMAGTNDLMQGKDLATIAQNYQHIIEGIRKESPDTKVFIQSVIPVNKEILRAEITNQNVQLLNAQLKTIADKSQSAYIDVFGPLYVNGKLDPQYTHDGLHLSGKGYEVWRKQIQTYVKG